MEARSDHVQRTETILSQLGFHLAGLHEIARGRAAAVDLVGKNIATVATLMRVQARTRCSVFVATSNGGDLIAATSGLPLTRAALPALASGRFNGIEPPDALIARPDEPVAALYLWGAAGLTWRGRTLALAASVALQREVYPNLPCYARAATDEGAKALAQRMGARPMAGGLLVAPPWIHPQIEAA